MALTASLLKEDPDKEIQLGMKRRATALLAVSAAIVGVAPYVRER